MEDIEGFLDEELGRRFTLKYKSICSPEQHIGNKVSQLTLKNDIKCWSLSSSQCSQAAINNTENYRSRDNLVPLHKAKSTYLRNCRPEADIVSKLTLLKASHSLIRILW